MQKTRSAAEGLLPATSTKTSDSTQHCLMDKRSEKSHASNGTSTPRVNTTRPMTSCTNENAANWFPDTWTKTPSTRATATAMNSRPKASALSCEKYNRSSPQWSPATVPAQTKPEKRRPDERVVPVGGLVLGPMVPM